VNADALKQHLKKGGATLVGIGDITEALSSEILHLNRGVAIAVNRSLNHETVEILSKLQRSAEEWLRSRGYLNLVIPPDSDRRKDKLITKLYKLFCHKTAATCSGLGWVGKNGLVINRQYGSKLSWATVLTNAPLDPDEPVRESECGVCNLCVMHCPSGAIRGDHWSISEPKKKIVAYEKCSALKKERQSLEGKPNCGFCVTVCPYSRKN
jgi:epoxyqueuosine reductase QueG